MEETLQIDYKSPTNKISQTEKAYKEAYEKWATHLDVNDEHKAKIAFILENQRLFLEQSSEDERWKNIASEVVKKIYSGFLGFDLVNIKPMSSPADIITFEKNKYNVAVPVDERWIPPITDEDFWIPLRPNSNTEETIIALKRSINSFETSEYCDPCFVDRLSQEVKNIFFREITKDLSNNVGTVGKKNVNVKDLTYEDISLNIVEMSGVIFRKTLRSGVKWIVTSKEIGRKIAEACHLEWNEDISNPTKIGTINSVWKLIVDPIYPEGEILLGSHDTKEKYESYFYCPYIALSQLKINEDKHGLISRYGKKLLPSGSKYFAKIKYEQV